MPRATGRGQTRAGLSEDKLVDDVAALLGSGTNVVSTCTDLFARGARLSETNRSRVLEACEGGNTSVWASGSDPGFITETVPMALLSVQRHVDLIEIEEFGDLSHRPSPHMVMEQMRFGKPLAEFDPDRRKNHLFGEYQPALRVLADLAGFTIDEWTAEGGAAAAKEDLTIVAGQIKAGTAAAQRIIVNGRSGGIDRIRFTQYGFVAMDVEPDWGLQPTGWRIRIHGDAPFDVRMPFPVPLDDLASFVPAFNANGPVNAIPYVCAAAPGFLTTEDLPHILPRGPAQRAPHDSRRHMTAVTTDDLGPLTRTVVEFERTMKRLVPLIQAPDDWAPLAEFVAVDEFERVGTFLEEQNWAQYTEMLTRWATATSRFETTVRRIAELDDLVYYEIEERHYRGDTVGVVNSMTVFQFDPAGKIRHLDVYLQQAG
jgi:2,4-diaminopentanoate dehydrogenase